jgi:CopA family copper-resistance protein
MKDRAAWGQMRMDPTDLSDVGGYAFLVNGKTPVRNETFLFRRGERVRLRLINGSAMTFLDVRIPGLTLTAVAADGNDVEPVTVDELRIGIAERYDVIVEPKDDTAYTLFAESLDRTGYARATLATAMGRAAPIPEHRPRTLLTMADMGGAHAGHSVEATASPTADHAAHAGHAVAETATPVAVPDHAAHDPAFAADHSAHAAHAAPAANPSSRPRGWAAGVPQGVKAIAYGDLKARTAHTDTRAPTRDIAVRLTGNMERYMWSLNGKKFADAEPIRVRYGERVRLTFANDTMMAHPMHLHGMFFEVENGQSDHKPLKDTVIVPPGQSVSVVLTAKEVGAWPLHCHLLYHMVSGMMTTFVVEPPGANDDTITPSGGAIAITPQAAHGHH